MNGLRWRLPEAPLRTSLAAAAGAGLLAGAALALAAGSWVDAGPRYPLKALAGFAVMMTVAAGLVADHHPFPRLGPANQITTIRVVLVALIAGLIGEAASPDVAWFVIGATTLTAVLDGADGWLARRSHMASRFGARFDLETDAACILVVSVIVWQHNKAPAWVMLCGLMRYGFVAAAWWLPWLGGPLRSTIRGKTVAVLQLVGLAVALAPFVSPSAGTAVAAATLAALVWSFALDVSWLQRQARYRGAAGR